VTGAELHTDHVICAERSADKGGIGEKQQAGEPVLEQIGDCIASIRQVLHERRERAVGWTRGDRAVQQSREHRNISRAAAQKLYLLTTLGVREVEGVERRLIQCDVSGHIAP
jgi:hypothetical protein